MTGTPGRPLSAELSEQLLSVAVDILAEEGWGRLNSDRIAARARAGKAGIYRRWPTMAVLARHAVGRFTLVAVPDDEGSLRADLAALVVRWSLPLDREERAAASLVGAARHEEQLRAAAEPRATAPDWSDRWDAMVAGARSKGYLSEDGASLQVHVVSAAGA